LKISSSAHGAFKIERLFALAIVIVDFARSPAVFARLLLHRESFFSRDDFSSKRQIGIKTSKNKCTNERFCRAMGGAA
jgi:hypothetical protein